MQVDALGEGPERVHERPLARVHRTRRPALTCTLPTRIAAAERRESRRRVLELDRHVAGVEAHAEVAPERRLALAAAAGRPAAPNSATAGAVNRWPSKKRTVSSTVSMWQQGSGSSASDTDLARALPEPVKPRRVADHQLRHPALVSRAADAPLVRARHGADGALEPGLVRQERGEQLGQAVAVREARVVEPVGQVHLLLDARPVERPVGEAVDREDVEAAVPEERPERVQLRRLRRAWPPPPPRAADPRRTAGPAPRPP